MSQIHPSDDCGLSLRAAPSPQAETSAGPPVWCDLVGWTLSDALARLEAWDLTPEYRPAHYRYRTAPGWQLQSAGWLAADGRLCVRYTRLQSAKLDVATLMVYPTAGAETLGIFAAEWIVTPLRCPRLVLDIEPAGPHLAVTATLADHFTELGRRWQAVFPTDPDMAPWFAEIAQPWALHSACPAADFPHLRAAYGDYLDTYMAATNPALALAPAGPDAPPVAAYKRHHAHHSPGRPLMARVFGADWTDAFLDQAHFAVVEATAPQTFS